VTPAGFPARCVVDASVIIKVILAEPASMLARSLLAGAALDIRAVPDLAYLECASILATVARRGLQTQQDARAGLLAVFRASLTVHPSTPLIAGALDLALTHGISVYDGVYLALADALGIPLITADSALVRAVGGPAARLQLLSDFGSP
jgi:predicted nucleic acid-binding protein